MSQVVYQRDTIQLKTGESVLDALLNAGYAIPHGCKSGVCHACMMIADAGVLPPDSQKGLKDTLKEQGCFLTCSCHPDTEIRIKATEESGPRKSTAVVTSKAFLSENVMRLRLKADIEYKPGQFIHLCYQNVARSYSLASVPGMDNELELHIKVFPDGKLSRLLADEIEPGEALVLQHPEGLCFYALNDVSAPLLMVGVGTGLAPLYGIARDALKQGHKGPIHLIVGAAEVSGLYYREELADLAHKHKNFHYIPCALKSTNKGDDVDKSSVVLADVNELVGSRFPNTSGMTAFLCGSSGSVKKLKKQIFLAGASMKDIHCDEFVYP